MTQTTALPSVPLQTTPLHSPWAWTPEAAARRDREVVAPLIPPSIPRALLPVPSALASAQTLTPAQMARLAAHEAQAWRPARRGLPSLLARLHQTRSGVWLMPPVAERFPELARAGMQSTGAAVLLWTLRRTEAGAFQSVGAPCAPQPLAYGFSAHPERLGLPPQALSTQALALLGTHDPAELGALALSQGWDQIPAQGRGDPEFTVQLTVQLWRCDPARAVWSGLSWLGAPEGELLGECALSELGLPELRREDESGAQAFWDREAMAAECRWPEAAASAGLPLA